MQRDTDDAVGAGLIAVLDYRLLAITVVGMLAAGYLFIRRPVPEGERVSREEARESIRILVPEGERELAPEA